jgi:hypothetical protein
MKRKLDEVSGVDDNGRVADPNPNKATMDVNDKRRSAPSKGDDACEPLTNQPIGTSNKEEYIF